MKHLSGLNLLEEREGAGTPANKGDRVLFNMRLFLNKGDEVRLNETQATHLPKEMIRVVDGVTLIDRTIVLGRREAVAGVEHALMGMKVGGYRKVRVSPHLAYRDKGIPDLIPPNAVLIVALWIRQIPPIRWSALMKSVGIALLTSCIVLSLSNLAQAEVMDKEPPTLSNWAWAILAGISAIAAWRWRWWAGVPVTLLGLLSLMAVYLELQDPLVGLAIRVEVGTGYVTQFYTGGAIWLVLNTIAIFSWINKKRIQR